MGRPAARAQGEGNRVTSTAQAARAIATPRLNLPFIIGASSVGTLIEWYDFYLYGVLALFFSKHFFSPGLDANFAFMLTLMLMGAATFVVGLLPGYETIGVLAPILLVAMRVLQGLALGGEY